MLQRCILAPFTSSLLGAEEAQQMRLLSHLSGELHRTGEWAASRGEKANVVLLSKAGSAVKAANK